MNSHANIETTASLDRRDFVKGAAGLTFTVALGGLMGRSTQAFAADAATLNAWITIGTDDTVTLLCPSAEMGQGVMTSLPLVLAEELDADWSKVKADWGPPIPPLYGNPHPFFNGAQVTAGSVAVPGYFNTLRMAGATRADRQRGEEMECSGSRTDNRRGIRRSRQIQAAHQLRRDLQVRGRSFRTAEDQRSRP